MPSFVIPELGIFDKFGTCLMIETSDEEIRAWFDANSVRDATARVEGHGHERWIQLTLNCWDDDSVHLHVEVSREDPTDETSKTMELATLIETIDHCIEQAKDCSSFGLSRAEMTVPRTDIPATVAISRLIGFEEKTGDAQLSLEDAALDIDDEWFTRLQLKHDRETDTVSVVLWAAGYIELDAEYLERFSELMAIGTDSLVFGRVSREATHAKRPN